MEAGEEDFSAVREVREARTVEVVVDGRVILGSDRPVHGHRGIGLSEAGI